MERTMIVEGEGTFETAPDSVWFECTLQGRCGDHQEATDRSVDAVVPLRDAVVSAGFPGDSLRSVFVSVRPVWENRRDGDGYVPEFAGYEYVHRLRMETSCDNLTVGRAMDAFRETDVQFSMSYHLKDTDDAMAEARSLAVADARKKAARLAEDAGVKLGSIVCIRYGASPSGPEYRTLSARANTPDMVPENLSFSDSVTLTWEIV